MEVFPHTPNQRTPDEDLQGGRGRTPNLTETELSIYTLPEAMTPP